MRSNPCIFALGFFDGVHLGHQALLAACCRMAAQQGVQAAAITFDRHPQSLFTQNTPPLINSAADRQRLLRQYGIGQVCSFPVTPEVMGLPWQDFVRELLEYGAVGFVCGNDFRFGHKGEGDARKLAAFCKEQGMPCDIVPEQTLDDIRISSTHIRKLIEDGNMETANRFLGHPHVLTGTVVPGHQLGRQLGIPTANLHPGTELAVPKFGVYACRCQLCGSVYPAVTNVGIRPTVSGQGITVESWLLGYEGDLYGQQITLEFHKFLRSETKYQDLSALKAQILRDAEQTRAYFALCLNY